jgi:tetratricopeptide (TPR) repeat protein
MHAFRGEGTVAVEDVTKAIRLTPMDPHRYFYDSLAATANLAAGNYEEALELSQLSLKANRTHTSTVRVMAASLWHLGREEEAKAAGKLLMSLEPELTVSGWLAKSPSQPYAIGKEWANVLREVGVPA